MIQFVFGFVAGMVFAVGLGTWITIIQGRRIRKDILSQPGSGRPSENTPGEPSRGS